jgi:hypothetical protein
MAIRAAGYTSESATLEQKMKVDLISPRADKSGIWIVEIDGIRLGLLPESGWALQTKDETRVIVEPQDMIFALPLLELGRQMIYSHLLTISQDAPDISLRALDFPEVLLLRCAFEKSVSDYWPLKGIEWISSSPTLADKLGDNLRDLQKRSWATQVLKQKIKLILKKNQMTEK